MNNMDTKTRTLSKRIAGFLYITFFFAFFILAAIKLMVNDGSWINYFIIFLLGISVLVIYKILKSNKRLNWSGH